MVTVTLASVDTLTRGGGVDIPGLSVDGQSYSGMCGYSDKGGWTSLDYPWMGLGELCWHNFEHNSSMEA